MRLMTVEERVTLFAKLVINYVFMSIWNGKIFAVKKYNCCLYRTIFLDWFNYAHVFDMFVCVKIIITKPEEGSKIEDKKNIKIWK